MENYIYLFFAILALVLNIIVSIILCIKSHELQVKTIFECSIIETIGVIIGAKILDVVINYDIYLYYLSNNSFYKVLTSGYTFLGGIFGAIFCIFIYSIFSKKDFEKLCNVLVPNLLLIYSISKIGCYCVGCCSGVAINGYILPIQLIETLIYFGIYIFIILRANSYYSKIYLTLILLGISRFLIGFLRNNTECLYLSISQVLSVFMVIIGIRIWYLNKYT